jgi:hypothetical protein
MESQALATGSLWRSRRVGSLIKALTYLGGVFKLRLTGQEKNDLIEYLKSI